MEKSFTVKAYAPLEAIIGFIISLGLGLSLIIDLGKYVDLQSWSNTLLQGILLIFTMACFILISQLTTYTITIKLDDSGIRFYPTKSFVGIKKQDKSIKWGDIKEWSHENGTASANAWSPDSFTIKQKPNKKTRFYVALGSENARFFEFFITVFQKEAENKGIKLKKILPLEETKAFAVIMTIVFICILVLMVWFFFFRPETDAQSKESGKMIIPVMSLVSVWFVYTSLKKAFFRKEA